MIEISFKSEEARIKGVAILLRSDHSFYGFEKNRFLIEDMDYRLVKDLINN